jgi:gluconate 2-dehydrogenase gamma chain
MNRRDMLLLLAGTAALPDSLIAMGRAVHRRARAGTLRAFDAHQNETVATIAELIIPKTDTPGAREAGVPAFIDAFVADWADDEDRQRVLTGLATLDERTRGLFGKDFIGATPVQQAQIVTGLEAEVARLRDTQGKVWHHFYYPIKRLTLVGYYTSEVGATTEQHFRVVPGRYEPCYPLES